MNDQLNLPYLFTLKQAASLLRVSVDTLNRERAAGRLAATRVRSRVFITSDQLCHYIESRAVDAPQFGFV